MGQKNQVFVYKFISRKSIEEKIIQLQKEKLQLFDTMVNGDADIMKNLSVEDVMRLLE
jgi:SNF2 family DNA or RNA helicase